jgi:ribosomal protein S18 acetylase RimI-like enzyme
LIEYRTFLNSDPPELARIWQSRPDRRGMMQPMSVALLEMFVFSKPYFDREGLIVAVEERRPIGFAHAGFGPSRAGDALSTDIGVICMLTTQPHPDEATIEGVLVQRCESYLQGRGALELRAGAHYPLCPFYLGLYGGSDMPGILTGENDFGELYLRAGYVEVERCLVFERDLDNFRPTVSRTQMQHRRQYQVLAQVNPVAPTFWDACVFGPADRIRFVLQAKTDGAVVGEVTFWDMGPLSTRWQVNTMGMISFRILQTQRGHGLGEYLLSEALRQLAESGVSRVQAQTRHRHEGARKVLEKLTFTLVDEGVIFGK